MWVLIKCNDEVLAETEFPKLKVEVPEGHRLLILNIVLKVHTPGPTSRENQSSFIPLAGKVDENLRKSSLNSRRDISVAFKKKGILQNRAMPAIVLQNSEHCLTSLIRCVRMNRTSRAKRMN